MNNFSTGSYDEFFDYAYRFYRDEAVASTTEQIFKDHINTILTRRNTVNGKLYKEDPVIMGMEKALLHHEGQHFRNTYVLVAWEIANEPQLAPKEWTDGIARYIHQRSPNQLVTAGIEGKYGYEDFWNTHSSANIDYTTCHLWVEK